MRLLTRFRDADAVSEVLRALRVRSTVFCLAEMSRPWALFRDDDRRSDAAGRDLVGGARRRLG